MENTARLAAEVAWAADQQEAQAFNRRHELEIDQWRSAERLTETAQQPHGGEPSYEDDEQERVVSRLAPVVADDRSEMPTDWSAVAAPFMTDDEHRSATQPESWQWMDLALRQLEPSEIGRLLDELARQERGRLVRETSTEADKDAGDRVGGRPASTAPNDPLQSLTREEQLHRLTAAAVAGRLAELTPSEVRLLLGKDLDDAAPGQDVECGDDISLGGAVDDGVGAAQTSRQSRHAVAAMPPIGTEGSCGEIWEGGEEESGRSWLM